MGKRAFWWPLLDTSRDGQLTPRGNRLSGAATMKANAPHKKCPAPFPEQGRGDLSRRETMQTFKIVRACCEYNDKLCHLMARSTGLPYSGRAAVAPAVSLPFNLKSLVVGSPNKSKSMLRAVYTIGSDKRSTVAPAQEESSLKMSSLGRVELQLNARRILSR